MRSSITSGPAANTPTLDVIVERLHGDDGPDELAVARQELDASRTRCAG